VRDKFRRNEELVIKRTFHLRSEDLNGAPYIDQQPRGSRDSPKLPQEFRRVQLSKKQRNVRGRVRRAGDTL
jgi:hypothetical protein